MTTKYDVIMVIDEDYENYEKFITQNIDDYFAYMMCHANDISLKEIGLKLNTDFKSPISYVKVTRWDNLERNEIQEITYQTWIQVKKIKRG